MMKIVLCLGMLAAAAAAAAVLEERHAPNYVYTYLVKDQHTHDIKSHWETQEDGKVRGRYKVVEPDGSLRTVEYIADGHNGFNAVVTREKLGHKHVTYHGKNEGNDVENVGRYEGRNGQDGRRIINRY